MISLSFARARAAAAFALVFLLAAFVAACGSSGGAPAKSEAELYQERLAAAEAGDAEAQFLLGYDLCCGRGDENGDRDLARATQWLCRAAHGGEPRAQYRLGMIYSGNLTETGPVATLMRPLSSGGPAPKPRLAAMWFDLAMAGGSNAAATRRLALGKRMEPADHLAVEKMRARWREAPCEWREVHGTDER